MTNANRKLRLRWIAANAVSELLGLGLTFAVIGFAFSHFEGQSGVGIVLLSFAIAVAAGAIEATLVGRAQWWAMHPWFPTITRFEWWRATLIGALIAYILGYLPSTIMSLGEQTSQAPSVEPSQSIMLLLAVGMGFVGGAVLSLAQWLTMRRKIEGAGWWMPANMLAWAAGMPIIFAGIDVAFAQSSLLSTAFLMAGTFLLTGIVVGTIHGALLVRLAERNNPNDPKM